MPSAPQNIIVLSELRMILYKTLKDLASFLHFLENRLAKEVSVCYTEFIKVYRRQSMKIKDGFVLEEVGSSFIAVAVGKRADDFSGLVRLNGTGAFFWNAMQDADITRDELVLKILSSYEGVERETVEKDVDAFIAKLMDAGILEA